MKVDGVSTSHEVDPTPKKFEIYVSHKNFLRILLYVHSGCVSHGVHSFIFCGHCRGRKPMSRTPSKTPLKTKKTTKTPTRVASGSKKKSSPAKAVDDSRDSMADSGVSDVEVCCCLCMCGVFHSCCEGESGGNIFQ